MSNQNLMFIGVGRIRDQLILASQWDRIPSSDKNEAESSFTNYLLDGISRFSPGSRDKRHFSKGTMFMLADRELCCIYACATYNKGYPERVAYQLLAELTRVVASVDEGRDLNGIDRAGGLTRPLRAQLKTLMERYDNPANVDKTAEVSGKVDHVKGIMQENITKVLATHANLSELEHKTDTLNDNAQRFERHAEDLAKLMLWRKRKITIMLGLVAAAILIYVVITIVNLVS